MNLRRQGFNLGMVTFDRWQSFDIQQELKQVGIKTDTVSVAKKHYEDLAMLVYEERVIMPHMDLLLEEMSELKITDNGKRVDHPRKKSKDLADAVTGAVFGAISFTPKDLNLEVEIHTWSQKPKQTNVFVDGSGEGMVNLKGKEIPEDVKDFLDNLNLL